MKKGLFLVGLITAALSMPLMANASGESVKTGDVENSFWISGTNLLRVQGESGFYVAAMDGAALTEDIYGSNFEYSKGYITAIEASEEINTSGILNMEGKVMVPFQYADIKVLNNNWIVAFVLEEATASQYDYSSWWNKDQFYLIKTADVYYVDGGSGNNVASLTRDQYLDASANGQYINIQDRTTNVISTYDREFNQVATDLKYISDIFVETRNLIPYKENGQNGLKDADGNVVMEPAFSYINDFVRGYAEVSTGEKNGLIDELGNVVIPAEYDKIKKAYYLPSDAEYDTRGYNANGYFAVVLDKKLGFVDVNGNVTCEPKYSEDALEVYGSAAVMVDPEGKRHLIAGDGVETILEDYESVYPLDFSGGRYYKVRDAQSKLGMIDWHGNVIFPCEYDSMALSGDGKYLLAGIDYNKGEIYQLNYETAGEGQSEPAAVNPAETEASTEKTDEAVSEASTGAAAEAASEASEAAKEPVTEFLGDSAEEPATEISTQAAALLDNAVTLLNDDFEANREAAAALIKSAAGLLGEDKESAVSLLNSAVTLLGTEGTDAGGVLTLVSSAKDML